MDSCDRTSLMLWRTDDHAFRVIEFGRPTDVLTNYDYILFDRKYEETLRSVGAQLQLTPVVVSDELRKLKWTNYLEATIEHNISTDDVTRLCPANSAIYCFSKENVFVSESLKTALQQVDGQALEFSLGLSMFAG